jgi:two-component system sensor histidine kinase TctE
MAPVLGSDQTLALYAYVLCPLNRGTLKVSAPTAQIGIAHDCLKDAIYELASNALKFSTAGKEVTIFGAISHDRYRIKVSDQGTGMTPEQRSQIGPFAQFERAAREQQGLGLGLAIALATARLAGGDLELSEGAGGVGLTVIFDLPITKP